MSKSKNPVAIITGGSRGVGKATALLLASKGWNVTLTCTSSLKDALKVAQQCIELGVEAQAISADVGDIDACKETVNQTLARWARIDCLINNAGTTKFAFNHGDLDSLDAEDFLHIYKINVVGPFQMVKVCKQHQHPKCQIIIKDGFFRPIPLLAAGSENAPKSKRSNFEECFAIRPIR